MNAPAEPSLTVWLDECGDGWISLHVSCGAVALRLNCTHWDDPFPGIVRWAKRLYADSAREVTLINQEGGYAHLVATAAPDGSVELCVHDTPEHLDPLPPPLLRWQGSRKELAATFYRAIHDFATSSAYDPRGWAYMRLTDWLILFDPTGRPLSTIVAALLATPRKRLLRQMKASCPYCDGHTGTLIPCIWNRSTIEVRRPILHRLLRSMPGSWEGADLPLLRCRALEILCYGHMRPLPERLRRLRC